MKTAKEWLHSFGEVDEAEDTTPTTNIDADDIKLIQLDAFKAGLHEASQVCFRIGQGYEIGDPRKEFSDEAQILIDYLEKNKTL